MGLQKYWQKRDFGVTSEPRGAHARAGDTLGFVVQRHAARRLHYDFRLELDGVLLSWAIPKGPNLDPAEKRLAVRTEDHPLEYASFEGEIPPKQYGAGQVTLWDRGHWIPQGDPHEGLHRGNLKFELVGEKLAGHWALVRMKSRGEAQENWLLVKERDDYARRGADGEVTTLAPGSVLTGNADKHRPKAAKQAHQKSPARTGQAHATGAVPAAALTDPKTVRGARAAALPESLRPQLATLASEAPRGDAWLSEFKFDGYRVLCRLDNHQARLLTRSGLDWTTRWPAIARAFERLPVRDAWFDSEVVALDEDGAIRFQLLQNWARKGERARLACYVFDLMHLDGVDLRGAPLIERKRLLQERLDAREPDGVLLYSEHVVGRADEVFQHACAHQMEGIIAKRAEAAYQSLRSPSWLKVKCALRQEFVIGGYTDPAGSRSGFGALLLGVYDDSKQLVYAGRVGTGFDEATLEQIAALFPKLVSDKAPFAVPPKGREAMGVHWLAPKLVAEVRFAEWTGSGYVRHAAFVSLRSDKKPGDIRREQALSRAQAETMENTGAAAGSGKQARDSAAKSSTKSAAKSSAKSAAKSSTKSDAISSGQQRSVIRKNAKGVEEAEVAGVRLTHPQREMFDGTGISKLDLAHYYEDIADWILPHLALRPLTLVRCPKTAGKQCFYQKHANQTTPAEVDRIAVHKAEGAGGKDKKDDRDDAIYMTVNRLRSLIALVQMGVLEIHTWGARGKHLDKPDRIIFDLDPAPDVAWPQVVEGAQLTHALLDEIGLQSFVKTTGGKGLHVVVPIKPDRAWDEIKPFSHAIARHLEKQLPDRFIANMAKKKRTGKIFVDYLRNGWEATAIAAYSTRQRPGAPVSVPLAWDELSADLKSDHFTVANVRDRLANLLQDPWEAYYKLNQRVTSAMLRLF